MTSETLCGAGGEDVPPSATHEFCRTVGAGAVGIAGSGTTRLAGGPPAEAVVLASTVPANFRSAGKAERVAGLLVATRFVTAGFGAVSAGLRDPSVMVLEPTSLGSASNPEVAFVVRVITLGGVICRFTKVENFGGISAGPSTSNLLCSSLKNREKQQTKI